MSEIHPVTRSDEFNYIIKLEINLTDWRLMFKLCQEKAALVRIRKLSIQLESLDNYSS
jgi:hypothetical protein